MARRELARRLGAAGGTMRRDIGYILAGLGTLLVVLAVVLPTYIAPTVIKWPLNQFLATNLEATNASYYNAQQLQPVTGVTIDASYTFKGNGGVGNSSTAVWDEFNHVEDTTNNYVIQLGTRRFAFDRKSADLVSCCGANVNGKNIPQTGIAGYAFPIGTQKKTYMVFDATDGKAEPFVFSGLATVHGIQTYMFVENVAPTPALFEPVPTDYQSHTVYYIDPVTGIPLNITEHETLTAQSGGTTLFDANFAMTPSSVTMLVGQDNSSRNKISLVRVFLPAGAGILGIVLLIVGALLARRGKRMYVQAAPVDSPASTVTGEVQGVTGEVQHPNGTSASDGRTAEATAELPVTDREANPEQ
jgi:hypothetical protein